MAKAKIHPNSELKKILAKDITRTIDSRFNDYDLHDEDYQELLQVTIQHLQSKVK